MEIKYRNKHLKHIIVSAITYMKTGNGTKVEGKTNKTKKFFIILFMQNVIHQLLAPNSVSRPAV